MKEIEETLNLFRSQPAYWDISSLSMAREAAESLLERIEQAQEDRGAAQRSGARGALNALNVFNQCQSESSVRCWRILENLLGSSGLLLSTKRIPRASTRRRSPWSERRQITHKSIDTPWTSTPSTRFGQLFWAQLSEPFCNTFHLVSLGEDSVCHFLNGVVCQHLGLCFPGGSDKVPLGSNCR